MNCIKCNKKLPAGALFCPWCGKKQVLSGKSKSAKRGNGEGSVFQCASGSWTASKVWGYELDCQTGRRRPIRSKRTGLRTKKDALEALAKMEAPKSRIHTIDETATLHQLFELWLADYQRRGRTKSTENCYKGAFKYFQPLHSLPISELGIDDLQECIDECPYGRRTRENMKTVAGLIYKYAIPRGYIPENINFAEFLFVGGCPGDAREAFYPEEVEIVRRAVGTVPYADFIYCQIYLGFRPHEFLTLDISKYNAKEHCFVGGGKTEAGTDRTVTISPRIQHIIDRQIADRTTGPVFCAPDGSQLRDTKYREDCFYPALKAMGLPLPGKDGSQRKLTPYCTRHTFATLMKNVEAPDKDKLELMGHTSTEMLRHYQHTNFDDLRRITDAL